MKNKISILLLICFLVNSCIAQCNNKKAVSIFEQDLKAIDYLITNPNVNQKDMPIIVARIEKITAIESESDGNYFGKFHPTKVDVKKWAEWLNFNKLKLCWSKKETKYYIINSK